MAALARAQTVIGRGVAASELAARIDAVAVAATDRLGHALVALGIADRLVARTVGIAYAFDLNAFVRLANRLVVFLLAMFILRTDYTLLAVGVTKWRLGLGTTVAIVLAGGAAAAAAFTRQPL